MRTDNLMDVPDGIAGGGPALFRLVRFWSRRWAADAARQAQQGAGDTGDSAAQVGHVQVLEAIDAAAAGAPVAAIADVAVQLGLDRSNASRMLASAVAAGLVTKAVHPGDARRAELGITPAGQALLAAARGWQDQVFARLVADWPAADARRLAGYLQRLAAQSLAAQSESAEITGGQP
jgi:DNA-binding MarR family transcriptional regulator